MSRFGGVCTGGELLYEPAPGEGSRAVYTSGRYNHATTNLAMYFNETSQDILSEA